MSKCEDCRYTFGRAPYPSVGRFTVTVHSDGQSEEENSIRILCEECKLFLEKAGCTIQPLVGDDEMDCPPHDSATATGMYDLYEG